MPYSFMPFSRKFFYIDPFLPGQFLIIALEAARNLEWQIEQIDENGFTGFTMNRSGKKVTEIAFFFKGNQAVLTSRSISGFIGFGRNSSNARNFSEQLIEVKYDLKPNEIESRWESLKNEFRPEIPNEEAPLEAPANEAEASASKGGFLTLLIPRNGYVITPVIFYLNIVLFSIQILTGVGIIAPEAESLMKWGGNYRPLTLTGQWWRLLTNCFLHIGVLHLLMNMYALIYIGLLLEPIIGRFRFGFAYLVSGILASVTSVWWHENTISAGASGAIFGMYGVFVALLSTNLIEKDFRKSQLMSILLFVLYNLAYGLKGGIDNAAHIGGLISGMIIGYTYYPFLKFPDFKLRNALIHSSALAAMAILSVLLLINTNNPLGNYNQLMLQFSEYEKIALSLYHLPQSTSDEKILFEIDHNAIPNWIKCQILIDSTAKINGLPDQLVKQNELLQRYCDYRIRSMDFLKIYILNKSPDHQAVFEQYNQKIDLIIRKLNGESVNDSELDYIPTIPSDAAFLYVVDGVPVDNINNLNASNIAEMHLLKGEAAVALYGEKARNGAFIVSTRSGSSSFKVVPVN